MKSVMHFLRHEVASVVLVLISFIPLFFIGALLDILLTHFYSRFENDQTTLPIISKWIHDSIAGYRFLPQELMVCFWILMVLLFIFNALISNDQQQFRIRFIYSYLFTWALALTTALLIAFASTLPFDLLLARVDEPSLFCNVIHLIMVLELVLIVMISAGLIFWRKRRKI
jgi:hypothetical protein